MIPKYKHALIVGAGIGLSASLARLFSSEGMAISLAARGVDDLDELCKQTGAKSYVCDSSLAQDVDGLFEALKGEEPDVVVYNPSARVRGPLIEIDREATKQAIMVTAYGAFLVAQAAAKIMVPNNNGAILFTGASASVKGYAQSASFAMGKFALRGLAQSMARELHPMGIHIGHFNIDGGIRSATRAGRMDSVDNPDSMLDPDAIAQSYLHFLRQHRSSWSWELEIRPWVEKF